MGVGLPEIEAENPGRSRRAARHANPTKSFPSIVISRDLADLGRIAEPDVSAVIIERPELRTLARSLRPIKTGESIPDLPEAVRSAMSRDAKLLVELLRRVSGHAKREILVVPGKECCKFHVDFHSLRALVTYEGAGTWVAPNEVVDTAFLCTGGDDVESTNARIVTEPRAIVRAGCGDMVLLKGARFGSGRAAVHRSPPQRIGRPRLMLKVTTTTFLRAMR